MDPKTLALLLTNMRASLHALEQAHERTANVHSEFLALQATVATGMKELVNVHARLVELSEHAPPARPATLANTADHATMEPAVETTPAPSSATPRAPQAPAVPIQRPAAPPLAPKAQQPMQAQPDRFPTEPKSERTKVNLSDHPAVVALVFQTVAQKTGYDLDDLKLSMTLEDDLGIDSIKRLEILAVVQEGVVNLPELDIKQLTALQTLAEVVEYLEMMRTPTAHQTSQQGVDVQQPSADTSNREAPPDDVPSAPLAVPTPRPIPIAAPVQVPAPVTLAPEPPPDRVLSPPRRVPVLIPAPTGRTVPVGGTIVITRDVGAAASKLSAALQERGVNTVLITPDWDDTTALHRALPSEVHGLVHLAAVGNPDNLRARVLGALYLAKILGPLQLVVTVSDQGGGFGIANPLSDNGHLSGALAALPKTLAKEWEDCRCLAIDIDSTVDNSAALATEILTDRGVTEIALHKGEACTIGVVKVPIPTRITRQPPVDLKELVVMTGGSRAMGTAIVCTMARRWRPTILLVGRAEVPEREPQWATKVDPAALRVAARKYLAESGYKATPKAIDAVVWPIARARHIRATLASINALGGDAHYASVDARDKEAVAAVLASAIQRHGPVRGIVHGASLNAESLIGDINPTAFESAFDTKVTGMDAVLEAVDPKTLRFVAFMSSTDARYGAASTLAQSMANEAIALAAKKLAREGLISKVFMWGEWDNSTMSDGILPPKHLAAAQMFCDEVEAGTSDIEVIIGGPDLPNAKIPTPKGTTTLLLSTDRQPWLAEHCIEGTPVLPPAMVLEWVAEAAARAIAGTDVRCIRNFRILKPVTVSEDIALTLSWREEDPLSETVRTISAQLTSGGAGPNATIYCTATVDLGEPNQNPPTFKPVNFLRMMPYPHELPTAYEQFLTIKPDMQHIDAILGMHKEGIVGRCVGSAPVDYNQSVSTWQTDPSVLGGVIQLLMLWVRKETGFAAIPESYGAYRQYAPLTGPLTAHLTIRESSEVRRAFDASILNVAGTVVATFEHGIYRVSTNTTPTLKDLAPPDNVAK